MITQSNKPASFILKVTGEIKAGNKKDESEREKEREKGSLVREVEYCAKGVAASVLNSSDVEFLNNLTT